MSDGAKDFWTDVYPERERKRQEEAERKRRLRPSTEEAMSMVQRLEFLPAGRAGELSVCPVCFAKRAMGQPGKHHEGCALAAIIKRWADCRA